MSVSFSRPGDAEGRESNNVVTVPQENISYALKEGEEFAGFFVRLFAYLIDLVYFSLLVIILFTTPIPIPNFIIFGTAGSRILFLLVFIFLPLFFYFSALLHITSTTPGKHFFGIKVVNSEGQKPSIWTSFKKVFFDLVSFFIFGYLNILKNDNRQSWSDKKLQLFTIYKAKKKESLAVENQEQILPSYVLKEDEEFAGFWKRSLIFFSDLLILTSSFTAFFSLFIYLRYDFIEEISIRSFFFFLFLLGIFGISFLSFLRIVPVRFAEYLFKSKIVTGDGHELGERLAIRRNFYTLFSLFSFGFLQSFKNVYKQSWADKKLNVYVILKKNNLLKGFVVAVLVSFSILYSVYYYINNAWHWRFVYNSEYTFMMPGIVAPQDGSRFNERTTFLEYQKQVSTSTLEKATTTVFFSRKMVMSADATLFYRWFHREEGQGKGNHYYFTRFFFTEKPDDLVSSIIINGWNLNNATTTIISTSTIVVGGREIFLKTQLSEEKNQKFEIMVFKEDNIVYLLSVWCPVVDGSCSSEKRDKFFNSLLPETSKPLYPMIGMFYW